MCPSSLSDSRRSDGGPGASLGRSPTITLCRPGCDFVFRRASKGSGKKDDDEALVHAGRGMMGTIRRPNDSRLRTGVRLWHQTRNPCAYDWVPRPRRQGPIRRRERRGCTAGSVGRPLFIAFFCCLRGSAGPPSSHIMRLDTSQAVRDVQSLTCAWLRRTGAYQTPGSEGPVISFLTFFFFPSHFFFFFFCHFYEREPPDWTMGMTGGMNESMMGPNGHSRVLLLPSPPGGRGGGVRGRRGLSTQIYVACRIAGGPFLPLVCVSCEGALGMTDRGP